MTQKQIGLIKTSWIFVETIEPETVGQLFYNRLFEIAPEVKHLFRSPIEDQYRKLLSMLSYIIHKLDALDDIVDDVRKLAHRHVEYGVKHEYYAFVGEALLWTLQKGLGKVWNEEVKEAWIACYTILSNAMMEAPGKKEQQAARKVERLNS